MERDRKVLVNWRLCVLKKTKNKLSETFFHCKRTWKIEKSIRMKMKTPCNFTNPNIFVQFFLIPFVFFCVSKCTYYIVGVILLYYFVFCFFSLCIFSIFLDH